MVSSFIKLKRIHPQLIIVFLLFGCTSNVSTVDNSIYIDSKYAISADKIDNKLSIAGDSLSAILPFVIANKGYKTAPDSYTSEKELDVTLSVESSTELLINRLNKDEYDLIILPFYDFLFNYNTYKKKQPVIVSLVSNSNGRHGLYSTNSTQIPFNSISGKTVSTVKGSASYQLVRFFMQQYKMVPDSVNWDFVDNKAELQKKMESSNNNLIAGESFDLKNTTWIVNSSQIPRFIPFVLIANRNFTIIERDNLTKLLNTQFYGSRFLIEEKNSVLDELQEYGIETEIHTINSIVPSTYSDNSSFFGIEQNNQISIYNLLNIELLAPESYRTRPSITYHGIADSSIISESVIDSEFRNFTPNRFTNRLETTTFTVTAELDETGNLNNSNLNKALNRAEILNKLIEADEIVISFTPKLNSNAPYTVRRILENSVRYAVRNSSLNIKPTADYSIISRIERRQYEGPYSETDTLLINVSGGSK
jgi:hypothetical protein